MRTRNGASIERHSITVHEARHGAGNLWTTAP
jgi:hypothetical protein